MSSNWLSSDRPIVNLALLVLGFGIGQGSLFIAQSYLILSGNTELLANFGILFSLLTLGVICVDNGCATILAQVVARRSTDPSQRNLVWAKYWELTTVRLAIALAVIAVSLSYLLVSRLEGSFVTNYLVFGSPALLAWAFNTSGILDGLGRSGFSGLVSALPYVLSSAALLAVRDSDPTFAGRILGSMFSIGYLGTASSQMVLLFRHGWKIRRLRPSLHAVLDASWECAAMLASLVPGQIYFRIQLLICSTFLGHEATAAVIYVKQIVSAVIQLIGLIRRTEFPETVRNLEKGSGNELINILRSQNRSILAALFSVALVATVSLLCRSLSVGSPGLLGLMLAYSFTIFSDSFSQNISQGLFARRMYYANSLLRLAAIGIGLAINFTIVHAVGYYSFAAADVLSHAAFVAGALVFLLSTGASGITRINPWTNPGNVRLPKD